MTYCSLTDAERVLSVPLVLRLLDDDNDGTADAAVVADMLDDVDAEINGYIGRNYDLTVLAADVPPTIRRIATDLFCQAAYLRRPEFLSERGETPWETRYKAAVGKLKELRDGKWRLDIDGDPAVPANVDGGVYNGVSDTYPTGIGSGTFRYGFGDF